MKETVIKQLNEIEDVHSYVFMHMNEVQVSIFGEFTHNAAYHFVLTLMRDRPEIVDDVKRYLKTGE